MSLYVNERQKSGYVLLDRDGTVIEERNYLSDPAGVQLLPGAVEGLQLLRDSGFALALITNQSGIGRGYFSFENLEAVHSRLRQLLQAEGIELQGIYVCPHAPEQVCECRKPLPKLAADAAADLGFSPAESWVVGDKAADIGLSRNFGSAGGVLVRTGYGRETEASGVTGDFTADTLLEAARFIVSKRLQPAEPS